MYNQLTIWYSKDKAESVRTQVIDNIKRQYGFSDDEISKSEDRITYLYDDETNGEIAIMFTDESEALRVTVEGTWSWETIDAYQTILPQFAEEDPA